MDAYGLGYQRVDDDGNIPFLVATMEATSRWPSIRELRAWEVFFLLLAARDAMEAGRIEAAGRIARTATAVSL